MDREISILAHNLQQSNGGHIFYCFDGLEDYIQNAVSYIISGAEQGEHIMVIENERLYPLMYEQLKGKLTDDQLSRVHYVNNFDFYCFHGDFHPPTILAYFYKHLEPYITNNVLVRTWGHVEWRDQEQVIRTIEAYEKDIDHAVDSHGLVCVCAYDASRVSEELKKALIKCHTFLMTDDRIIQLPAEQAEA